MDGTTLTTIATIVMFVAAGAMLTYVVIDSRRMAARLQLWADQDAEFRAMMVQLAELVERESARLDATASDHDCGRVVAIRNHLARTRRVAVDAADGGG